MAVAVGARLHLAGPGRRVTRLTAAAGVLALSALLALFAAAGPLRPGWSERAQAPTAAAHDTAELSQGGTPQ